MECPLVYDGDKYEIDFIDLEKKLSDPQTTLMILCNPHNPVGKIWGRETLAEIGRLCEKHHVTVISDEIHCDLTAPGKEYIPFASVSETCKNISITCVAPTKAFNIAGLQTSAVIVAEPFLRHKVWRALNTDEIAEPNAFAVDAAIAAFTKGENWLDALQAYIHKNRQTVTGFLESNLSELKLVSAEATYLLWIDCSAVTDDSVGFTEFLRREAGLYLSDGAEYGETGRKFVRMNIACPISTLRDGLSRLKTGTEKYKDSRLK